MCVNNLSKVALDNAAAGIEPATSSRKSNALTTTPPSHTTLEPCADELEVSGRVGLSYDRRRRRAAHFSCKDRQ